MANYVTSFANQYFATGSALVNNPQFDRFLKLFAGLNVEAPAVGSDQLQLIIYLSQGNFAEIWSNNLIERINSEVLVDKKSQQPKFLKVNKYFSVFLVKNFEKLMPQLERLLVRSESNI